MDESAGDFVGDSVGLSVGEGVGRGMSQQLGHRSLTVDAYAHQPKLPVSGMLPPQPGPLPVSCENWHVHKPVGAGGMEERGLMNGWVDVKVEWVER